MANTCNWTLFCSGGGNIHPNDTGHALVAQSFEHVVDGVAVSTAPLPAATVKQTYGGQLTAVGGHPRYHWSLAPGSGPLPTGLRLRADGTFGGKPTVAGSYSFTVQVVDTKLPITSPPATDHASAVVSLTVNS